MSLLRELSWKTKYDSDELSLVSDFYVPVLECAVRYDRSTGYFTSRVLTLAARGIEGLVRNDGRMRLVVGCTLASDEVDAIEKGLALRDAIGAHFGRVPLRVDAPEQADALELVAWMVANGFLEVRIAVPCTLSRKPWAGSNGIFHEKAGILMDKTGDRLAFNGSVNETAAGWGGPGMGNWESFHVFCDWDGGKSHVNAEQTGFDRLWDNEAKHCLVVDIPTAVRDDLLRFLPANDGKPKRLLLDPDDPPITEPPPKPVSTQPVPPAPKGPDLEALRRSIWHIIRQAPAEPNGGEWVGEATSGVEPWPHQVRAFQRMYDAWPPKLLIADEVGLGKTIEAGLLLRQAWLSGRAKRILVLAPRAVLTQWQIELREKFNLNWPIYDGHDLRWYDCKALSLSDRVERKVGRDAWHKESCVIASSQLMRRTDRAKELLVTAEPWDLIVLDEAHHARRRGAGAGTGKDKGPNQLLRLMQGLKNRTQGLVLLTATPMQVHPIEVWDLLSLLGLPESWTEDAFNRFFEKVGAGNPSPEDFEWLAMLFRSVVNKYGAPTIESVVRQANVGTLSARKVLAALVGALQTPRKQLSTEQRRIALDVIKRNTPVARLISRHTRDLLRQYQAAGKLTTRIATRHVHDEFVELSTAERAVYEAVEDYISNAYNRAAAAERNAVGFVMTIYRRRLASSFHALATTLAERLKSVKSGKFASVATDEDVSDDVSEDEAMDTEDAQKLERQALVTEETTTIEALLSDVKKLPVDTKAKVLLTQLNGLVEAEYFQVIVFTQYTATLDFLKQYLVDHDFRVLCFSGNGGETYSRQGKWLPESREKIKRLFRGGEADVLIATDAAAEGLNFQFCGALINYDMPWNPMRVEQRIGRIDRLGQKFEDIRIINLHYEDTVETDVYRALGQRIGLFKKFVGKLQPILATLPSRIAQAALARRGDDDEKRQSVVSDLDEGIRSAEAEGFDIDEATDADLETPTRPAPYYDLKDLDKLIQRPQLLPPGIKAKKIARYEYEFTMPGMKQPLRVTTSRDLFEEHPGTYELWSPGSPLFPVTENGADEQKNASQNWRLASVLVEAMGSPSNGAAPTS